MSGLLTEPHRRRIAKVFDSPGKRFTDLVREAGLDPSRDLRGKALRRMVLQPGEDVTGYDFTGADLSGAVLRRVDLRGAVLAEARLAEADLRGAQLSGAVDLAAAAAAALTGAPPPALRRGPNRLWPHPLTARINAILAETTDDSALFVDAQNRLDAGDAVLTEHLFRTLLDWRGAARGPDHPNTFAARYELARAISHQGRIAEAEALFRVLVPDLQRVMGEDDRNTLTVLHELARAILDQCRAAEAEAQLRDVLADRQRVNGREHAHTAITARELARALLEQGRALDAAALWADRAPESVGPDAHQRGQAHLLRAALADARGDAAQAEAELEQAADVLAPLHDSHYARRMLVRYRETRTPGAAGGTTIGAPSAP